MLALIVLVCRGICCTSLYSFFLCWHHREESGFLAGALSCRDMLRLPSHPKDFVFVGFLVGATYYFLVRFRSLLFAVFLVSL